MGTRVETLAPQVEAEPARLEAPGDQRVVWPGIGWEGYEALLQIQGERSRPRILYLDGDVILMSPSQVHERRTDRLGALVREVYTALDIPCIATRETTFRRGQKGEGVQLDDSFYFANSAAIAAKEEGADIDLRVDPPPPIW